MSTDRPFFVTTPIYYVNDTPHLGHAYPTVAADVLARFMRLDGRRVKFLTGNDEHGQKVERSAQALGLTPLQFADRVSAAFREMDRLLDISYDDYIRTTEERHIRGVQALWQELERRGEIYLGRFAGWYCVRDEAFYDESELIDGPDGRRAPTGAEVEWLEEENYFFRLSAWQERLLAFYEAHPDAIAPRSRRNEVISFIRAGLKDLSISRTSFSWGIPVPENPNHVIYVWLDALTNYITALGYPSTQNQEFSTFWPTALPMAGGPSKARRCRSPSATAFRRMSWSTGTAPTPLATSYCANCRSAMMETSRTARWLVASTATLPMISAICRNAFWS